LIVPIAPKNIILLLSSLSSLSPLSFSCSLLVPLASSLVSVSALLSLSAPKMPLQSGVSRGEGAPTPLYNGDSQVPPRPRPKNTDYYDDAYVDELDNSPSRYPDPCYSLSYQNVRPIPDHTRDRHILHAVDSRPLSPLGSHRLDNHPCSQSLLQSRSNSCVPQPLVLDLSDDNVPNSYISVSSGDSTPRYHASIQQNGPQDPITESRGIQEKVRDLERFYKEVKSQGCVPINNFTLFKYY
jgi:hypothetical protein